MLLELLRHGYRHGLAHLHHSPNIHAHFPQTPSLTLQHFALVEPWPGRARSTARQASYSWFPSAGSSTYLVCHPVYQLITHGPIVHFLLST
jgi:hypothetical protein